MKGFSIKSKKTPFQRHKELEEEKKRKADEEAAKVYEEFVESFKSDEIRPDDGGVKSFVHGGVAVPGSRTVDAGRKAGSKYTPSFLPPAFASTAAAATPPGGGVPGSPGRPPRAEAFTGAEDDEDESVFQLPSRKADKDKPKNIDKMLDMLKREQEMRDERDRLRREGKPLPPEHAMLGEPGGGPAGGGGGFHNEPGSFDDGDPFTTNLYVGNIHPDIHEANLAREFGRFGPIASVKIMWPRDEEQRRRGRNCGFVAFMTRQDAAAALAAMNGLVLNGYEMKIGWGKAVPLPAVPLYAGTGAPTGPLTAMVPPSSKRGEGIAAMVGHVPAVGYFAKESTQARKQVVGVGADIEVKIPDDPRMRFLIDSMALYVWRDGCEFEQLMMLEQQGNAEYEFLFDLDSALHAYYRWRLYSLAEGDTLRTWRIDPFQMVEGGQAWLPPPMLALEVAAANAGKAAAHERGLSDMQRDRLEDLLRGLSAERESICEAMVFALDNADAAGEVVEVLAESLTLPETAPATKLARLFLVNDILHNATAPVRNASRYRGKLEAALPDVFESFQLTYRHADSRRTQETLRRYVLRVLRVWRERFIFPDDFLNGLQAAFLRPALADLSLGAGSADAAGGFGLGAAAGGAVKLEEGGGDSSIEGAAGVIQAPPGKEALLAALEALPEEELLRKGRSNGLSCKGGRPAVLQRLLALDEYLSSEGGSGLMHSLGLQPVAPSPAAADGRAAAASSEGMRRAGSGGGGVKREVGPWGDAYSSEDEDPQQPGGGLFGSVVLPGADIKAEPGVGGFGVPASSPHMGRMTIKMEADVAGLASLPPAAVQPATPAAPLSRWEEVDEAEEKAAVPSMPISKWLAQEEAVRQQAEAEATAAAARDAEAQQHAAAAATAAAARAAVEAAGGMPTPSARRQEEVPMDEGRRQRLREVELQVLLRREQLEEEGRYAPDAIEASVAQLRQQLIAQLDAAAAAGEAARPGTSGRQAAAADEGGGHKGGSGRGSHHRERSGSRSRSPGDRKRRRSSSKDRGRDRDKGGGGRGEDERRRGEESSSRAARDSRDGDKDRRRGDGDSRSKDHHSRDRDRERDARPRDREQERGRDGDKDRDREKDASRRKRSRSRSRDKDRSRSRDGGREADKQRDKDRSSGRGGTGSRGAGRSSRSSRSRSRERRSSKERGRDPSKRVSSSRKSSRSRSRSRSRDRGSRDNRHTDRGGSSRGADAKRHRS